MAINDMPRSHRRQRTRWRAHSTLAHPRTESIMFLSRRSFVKAASVTGIGAFTAPLIAARGSEALRDGILEHAFSPTAGGARFESDERAAFRLISPDAIRLDSNENPNGPGQVALDAVRAMFG